MIGVAASGSAVGKLNICAQQHYCFCFFSMFGAVNCIYCINSSIVTRVDSTYLGY